MPDNHLRGILKAFGRKVGKVDQARFVQRVRGRRWRLVIKNRKEANHIRCIDNTLFQ